jgi:hypothetical protein
VIYHTFLSYYSHGIFPYTLGFEPVISSARGGVAWEAREDEHAFDAADKRSANAKVIEYWWIGIEATTVGG